MLEHRRYNEFYHVAADRGYAKEKSFYFVDNFGSAKWQVVDAGRDLPIHLLYVPCVPCICGFMSTCLVPFVVSYRHFLHTSMTFCPPVLYVSMSTHLHDHLIFS